MKKIDGGSESVNACSADAPDATLITGQYVYLMGHQMGSTRWCPFVEPATIVCMMGTALGLPSCLKSDLSTCGWSGATIRADAETTDPPIKEKDNHV